MPATSREARHRLDATAGSPVLNRVKQWRGEQNSLARPGSWLGGAQAKAEVGEADPQLAVESFRLSGTAGKTLDAAMTVRTGHFSPRRSERISDHSQGSQPRNVKRSNLANPESEGGGFLLHPPNNLGLPWRGALGVEDGEPWRLSCPRRLGLVVFAQFEMPELQSWGLGREIVLYRGEPEDYATLKLLHGWISQPEYGRAAKSFRERRCPAADPLLHNGCPSRDPCRTSRRYHQATPRSRNDAFRCPRTWQNHRLPMDLHEVASTSDRPAYPKPPTARGSARLAPPKGAPQAWPSASNNFPRGTFRPCLLALPDAQSAVSRPSLPPGRAYHAPSLQ